MYQKAEDTDPVRCGSPERCRGRTWQTPSLHFCFSVENILIKRRKYVYWHAFAFKHTHAPCRARAHTHIHTHLLHCLCLSSTRCHWSRRLHFGLWGLCVGSLSLELTPWCRPLIPGTSPLVYQCLQETRKSIITHSTSPMLFCVFNIVNTSH